MKKLLLGVAWVVAGVACAGTLDGIAAKVDRDVITVGDVMNEIRRHPEARNRADRGGETEMQALYRTALENLVDRKLILKAASDRKLDMQEWLVDNRIREIVHDSFDGDMNKLTAELDASKVPMSEWRNKIREDMIVSAMRYQMVENAIRVSPAQLKKEFGEHPERYVKGAKADVRVILLKPAADDKTPSVGTRADEIFGRLDKGEDFGALARKHSADSHAKDGGLWSGVDPEDVFREEICAALAKLKVGETSKLIDLDGWGFIVRKERASAKAKMSLAEAYDLVEKNVKADLARDAYAAWVNRLRADAFVKIYPAPAE